MHHSPQRWLSRLFLTGTLLLSPFFGSYFFGPQSQSQLLMSQEFKANYDETKIPPYTLPPLLQTADGKPVTTAEQWPAAREHWLKLCADHIYGTWDCPNWKLTSQVVESGTILEGRGLRTQYEVTISNEHGSHTIDLLVYLPASAKEKKVPVFLGLNFAGNHAAWSDPEIRLPKSWLRSDNKGHVVNNRATEAGRGGQEHRWPVDTILEGGFGVATAYYGDIAPDDAKLYPTGLPRLAPDRQHGADQPTVGGAIACWSWGLSRLLDVLEKDSRIDSQKVAVIGHSRLGKTALWAGATDPRFYLVISNNSGCGGAALSRRQIGETVQRINTSFPHWFNVAYRQYNLREDACPVDQHTVLSLIAPRPLYVASASEDTWADPKGEFISAQEAGVVYQLLGKKPLPKVEMPKPDEVVYLDGTGTAVSDPADGKVPQFANVGYHLRKGPHDLLEWDWIRYMQFARNQ